VRTLRLLHVMKQLMMVQSCNEESDQCMVHNDDEMLLVKCALETFRLRGISSAVELSAFSLSLTAHHQSAVLALAHSSST
jgi:hypothetical protein